MEDRMEIPEKTKTNKQTRNKTTIRPSNPSTGLYPEETIIEKDTCTPMFIAALFTTAKIWKKPKCPWTRMDKEVVTCIQWNITQP